MTWTEGIISGVAIYAMLMVLHYGSLLIGWIRSRRNTRHYEVVGHLPNGRVLVLPEGYNWDDDGIIVRATSTNLEED